MSDYKYFIDEKEIFDLLGKDRKISPTKTAEVLDKALELKGLDLEDTAYLLNLSEKSDLQQLFDTALKIKEEIYGNRLVLFAPLYISNFCSNNCLYCGFRSGNTKLTRRVLSLNEIAGETSAILEQGHKRILMLAGENHTMCGIDYLIESIEKIYSVRDSKNSYIRRINLEVAPFTEEEFRLFSDVRIGTYTVFQETYHKDTYLKVHPSGKKADYYWRLNTMDRALSNGMHDVGIGALFGLFDFKFEVLSLLCHSKHLDKEYNTGPHTISVPRIRRAANAPASEDVQYMVNDADFMKLVAVLRCSVPYTGMILSTREPVYIRSALFRLGISQISAGSKTSIGGYKDALTGHSSESQFQLNDCRNSGEVIRDVIKQGFVPSFCTACYRLGRVGEDFMDLAKPGLIKIHCQTNALTTLNEYLTDYADEGTKLLGEALITKELENISNPKVKAYTEEMLARIERGERDLYL